jgi:nitroreductase
MDFLDLIKTRRSVRGYAQKQVSRELIEKCLESARLAPSACNSQPWHFVVVDDQDLVIKAAGMAHDFVMKGNRFASSAPVIVAVVAEKPKNISMIGGFLKNKPFYLIDIGIAVEHFCLQATESGLGTCILGWFNEKGVKKLIGVPSSKRIALLITVGWPESGVSGQKIRKPLEEIRSYNRWH